MDLRVAAYAVIERRGKILLTHWRRGHLHGWTLPGGGLEAGEDPRDAVVREILEETGLEGKVGKLLGVDSRVMVREDAPEGVAPELHTIRIVYRGTVKDGPLHNEIGGSSDEARWVPLRELKSLRTLSLVQTGLHMAGINLRKAPAKGSKQGQAKQGQSKQNQSKTSQGQQQTKQAQPKQPKQSQPVAKHAQPSQAQPKQNQPKSGQVRSGQPKQEQEPKTQQRSSRRSGRARRRADSTGGQGTAVTTTSTSHSADN